MSQGTKSTETKSLGTALPQLMARVRDEILPLYIEIGPAGAFGAMMIRKDLDAAAKAMIEGDVIAIIAAYQKLKEIK